MANSDGIYKNDLLVLVEESSKNLIFRFRGKTWGLMTLMIALGLVAVSAYLQVTNKPVGKLIYGLYGLCGAFLYSTLYSFIADIRLVVDGTRRSFTYRKKTLYCKTMWERRFEDFEEVKVIGLWQRGGTGGAASLRWFVLLISRDGLQVPLTENTLINGSNRPRAMSLAQKVSKVTGVAVKVVEPESSAR